MQILLEYLKEKKIATSPIPDIYLPNKKANFYYNNFYIVNILFYFTLGLVIIYYILKTLDLFILWKSISIYLILFVEEGIYCTLIFSNLIFFYTLNKNKLLRRRRKKGKKGEQANTAVDIDVKQEENISLSEREDIRDDIKEEKIDKNIENDENNDENNDEENDKINHKINEESDNLKE